MAAEKKLIAVTLQLEVKNGLDKNSNQKYKNVSYESLDPSATADQLLNIGKEFSGLMDEAPTNMYVLERHHLGLTA
jgi:hypothetical protein